MTSRDFITSAIIALMALLALALAIVVYRMGTTIQDERAERQQHELEAR